MKEGAQVIGAGAAEKDQEILQSFAIPGTHYDEKTKRLNYVLVDVSINMLIDTLHELDKQEVPTKLRFVDAVPIAADFTGLKAVKRHLEDLAPHLNLTEGRAAHFFLGGTISNIEEDDFLEAIRDATQPGDIVAIGLEFADEGNVEAHRKKLDEKYNQDSVKSFFVPIVRSVLDEYGIHNLSNEEIEPRIKAKASIVKRATAAIKNLISVKLWAEINGKEIIFQVMNRYYRDEFLSCCEGFALRDECIGSVLTDDTPSKPSLYRLLMFERV